MIAWTCNRCNLQTKEAKHPGRCSRCGGVEHAREETMQPVRVINIRTIDGIARRARRFIYVGREHLNFSLPAHPLANPFVAKSNSEQARRGCLQMYVDYLNGRPNWAEPLIAQLAVEVRDTGFPLACFCCDWDGIAEPAPICHAVELARRIMQINGNFAQQTQPKENEPMSTATKTKSRRKQGYLDGMEPKSVRAIDDAADNYFEVMQERVKLSKEEDEKKDALIDAMKEAGVERYETPDGLIVTVTNKSNVKCKRKNAESENGDGEEGED